MSPQTIRNAYARLRTVLLVAFEDKRISWLPPKTLKLPPIDDAERRALTIAECNTLLEILAAHRLFMLYKLEIATGMREAEMIGLQWEMIDWKQGEIRLSSQLKWLRADKRWERLPLKNRKKPVIPLDAELLEKVRAHQAKIAEERKVRGEGWKEHDLVFPSEVGTPINARNLLRQLELTAAKAKLGKVTFHELRHTAGSLMLQNGKTMTTVSKILGHSSVGVTEKIHAHSYEDDKREAVASVTRRLRPATKEAQDDSKN